MELLVIATLLTVSGAQLSHLDGPQNIQTTPWSYVRFKCKSISGNCSDVDWVKDTPQTNPETVFDYRLDEGISSDFGSRYRVDDTSGCDLVINNVQLTDGGRFTCRVFRTTTTYGRSAYLIILESQPKCAKHNRYDDIMEGDRIRFTYEVTYSGTAKASMIWRGVENAPVVVENGGTISRSYSVVASAPEVPSFDYVISFGVGLTGVTSSYSDISTTCNLPAIEVLYSVRNVTLSPSLFEYSPGTIITCMAKGHPPPTFKWQVRDLKYDCPWMDIENQSGNQFTVSNVTSKRYRCVAMNVVRGISYSATSDEIKVNNKDELTCICPCHSKVHVGVEIGSADSSEDYVGVGFENGTSSEDQVGLGVGNGNSSEDQLRVETGIAFGVGLIATVLLASIAFAILVRLGHLEFQLKPANQPSADATQPQKQEESPSTHQHTSITTKEAAPGGPQESAYAPLESDRERHEYEMIELRQKAKAKEKSKP